jgi:hypothetical protein
MADDLIDIPLTVQMPLELLIRLVSATLTGQIQQYLHQELVRQFLRNGSTRKVEAPAQATVAGAP